MATQPERACAVCDVTNPEIDYALITRACGHVLCPICHGRECPVCAGDVPNEDEETPLEHAIEDGRLVMWAYGELDGIEEVERYAREQFVMILTCLRLWAEECGLESPDAWREAWQRSVAITSARKVS